MRNSIKQNTDSAIENHRSVFLPRLAKQKVLEKFIDLSTADVFNKKYIEKFGFSLKGFDEK